MFLNRPSNTLLERNEMNEKTIFVIDANESVFASVVRDLVTFGFMLLCIYVSKDEVAFESDSATEAADSSKNLVPAHFLIEWTTYWPENARVPDTRNLKGYK
jgi:hypothetical protein